MRIRKDLNAEAIEGYLRELSAEDETLMLPTNLRYAQLGGEASMVQFIVTWALLRSSPILKLYADGASDPQISDLVSHAYGLVAALSANEALSKDNISILLALRQAALARLSTLESDYTRSGTKGPAADIVCADHLGRGRPNLLYRGSDGGSRQLREEREFWGVARLITNIIVPQTLLGSGLVDDYRVIGSFLYEIFKNTEEHATSNYDGSRMRISLRGLMARHYALTDDDIRVRLSGNKPLEDFCRNAAMDRNGRRQFVEISVFDSGPGFAARLLSRPTSSMTLVEEYDAISRCFQKNVSSKDSVRYGQGLPYVMSLLKSHGGFFRIRTGRLSLCLGPNDISVGAATLRNTAGRGMTEYAETRGSLLSLVLPLRWSSEELLPLPF